VTEICKECGQDVPEKGPKLTNLELARANAAVFKEQCTFAPFECEERAAKMAEQYEEAIVDATIDGRKDVAHMVIELSPFFGINSGLWREAMSMVADRIVDMNKEYRERVYALGTGVKARTGQTEQPDKGSGGGNE